MDDEIIHYSKAPMTEDIPDVQVDASEGFTPQTLEVYLTRPKEQLSDELPAVYQSPIIRTVSMTFYYAIRHQPLPFPNSDD